MVGWRTAGAWRMEDGKERDLNQSSFKMDGARRVRVRWREEEERWRCRAGCREKAKERKVF